LWLNDDISNDALEDSEEGDSEISIDNSDDEDNIPRPAKRMRTFCWNYSDDPATYDPVERTT
jgi:hypothetical protein